MSLSQTAGGRGVPEPSAAGSPVFDQLLREHPEHRPAVLDALYAPSLTAAYTPRHLDRAPATSPALEAPASDGTILSWE